ncbi:alginate export family protein [Flagellimonas algicola]|uniref:Alginate export domain-containing protein n=1 Tax=Flagellimonas algicola TaxID=2583815 RepID=A0ABY2WNN5_9FLAO|nr:alginate export family protein [Allomuricauda algicola]TMU56139.1 hypothetical protein FGG15_00960 [Allomuricauda algicola]
MTSNKFTLILIACGFLSIVQLNAQLTLEADLRARFEYRHGFNNLFPDNADPAAFVTQRSRLNLGYRNEMLRLYISVQDVSTWGDTRQLQIGDDNNSFGLFQAWGQLYLDENWSIKAGRQAISYDDQRIFGEVDWTMQGRFHDAALLKYEKDDWKVDLGLAFSQEDQSNEGTGFFIQGFFTYKAMQYAHAKKTWDKSSISFLALNTGFQNFTGIDNDQPDGTFYTHTAGSHFSFPIDEIKFNGNVYYQFGKANATTDLAAYLLALEANYKPGKTLFGLGFELISGTDQAGESKNKSFFPLYGTNHKFNGFMDYFYVGNHANNVGLNDLYAKVVFATGEKNSLLVKGHYFAANAAFANDEDSYLGTELDLVFNQQLMKYAKINLGYSHMFASESMSLIKGGRPHDNTNNWAWVQLIIKPELFKTDFPKK